MCVAAAMAVVAVLSGCVGEPGPAGTAAAEAVATPTARPDAWTAAATTAALALPELSGPYTGETLVGVGVRPPTNSWVSGAVFNGGGQPIFPGVLALKPESDGVGIGLPIPAATAKAVFGSFVDDVHLGLDADGYVLARLDGLAATFRYSRGDTEVGSLTAVQGWPYLQYVAAEEQEASLPGLTADGDDWSVTVGETEYAVVLDGSGTVSASGEVRLDPGDALFLYAEPEGASADDRAALRAGAGLLTAATAEYAVADGLATTTFTLRTDAGDTVFAQRPHMDFGLPALSAGYETIYGASALAVGSTFSFAVPESAAIPSLDLSALASADRSSVIEQVKLDAAATSFTAPDSYAGGKQLYRAASLYTLAAQLGQDAIATDLSARIRAEFELWFDPAGCVGRTEKCFVYDPVLGGVTGYAPAYGSDEFNDHHFHYGYFLYALGIMASSDPSFVEPFRTVADAISADIAAPTASDALPQRRSFDDYEGHSWASGTSPFADGNNQESASEAITAWAGLSLWAQVSGATGLAEEASWMFSVETATARRYWLGSDLPEGFTSPFFALNWGGKRDYATFFDATPSAILGVELIPMSPSTAFLPDAERTARIVNDAIGAGSNELPLIDYVVMLQATVDKEAALQRARSLPDSRIDGGDSRSYLLAWILTRP